MTGDSAPERHPPSSGVAPDGASIDGWPAPLAGVTETVVATRGPNERWNHAALGLGPTADATAEDESPVDPGDERAAIARTWGRTRTRRNFTERGRGYVQFTRDPVDFVAAAVGVHETDDPILDRSAAWAEVAVERVDAGIDDGTEWVEWTLRPVDAAVRERIVPTIGRGTGAVVEATVAASRLDVDAYDTDALLDRLTHYATVVEAAGGPRERAAFERIDELVGWQDRRDE